MGFVDKALKVAGPAGNLYSLAKTAVSLGKSGIDLIAGDKESAKTNFTDAAVNAVEGVPGLGTAVSAYEWAHDSVVKGRVPEPEFKGGSFVPGKPENSVREDVREFMWGKKQPWRQETPVEGGTTPGFAPPAPKTIEQLDAGAPKPEQENSGEVCQ